MPTVDVFLANPIVTATELPPLDIKNMRFVYRLDLPDGDDEALLEQAFRVLNIDHPADYGERSLSVGDVVTIDGLRSYRCDWVGWQTLECCLRQEVVCG